MESSTNVFHAISHHLPEQILQGLKSAPVDELALDNLVRLIIGAEPSPHSGTDLRAEWSTKQISITSVLSSLNRSDVKRSLEDSESDTANKRPRLSPPEIQSQTIAGAGRSVYSLKPISSTAPIRKKVEIDIRENAIIFLNSATKAPEGSPIPLSILRRAFLLPTRGKTKPHWTVVILSSDYQPITGRGKPVTASADEKPQIIFGIDAKLTASLEVTSYDAEGKATATTHAKNTDSLPVLRQLLSHLPIPVLEPNSSVFKSAVPGLGKSAHPDGVPGIEAYRSAKPGSLWFMREGILWGESKPCEFWAVEDLVGKAEGLKIIGGVGKTCSVILTRKSRPTSQEKDFQSTPEGATADNEPEEDPGEETEFSMVDSKEKEGIEKWIKRHQHVFGAIGGRTSTEEEPSKSRPEKVAPAGPLTIHNLGYASDSSDGDFAVSSDDDSSAIDSDSDDSEEEDDDDEAEKGEGKNASAGSGVSDEEEEEEEELDPKHHPLLRAGRLPRMSKAAMDMAVGMVMDDMAGGSDEEEVDELMD